MFDHQVGVMSFGASRIARNLLVVVRPPKGHQYWYLYQICTVVETLNVER
jgi:hypothetical protein